MNTITAPLTSVILVSFHTGVVLSRTIESVLGQTAPCELILVDNGNPPEVVEALQALAARDTRVRLLTGHGNIGFGRGNNLGVAASRGDFLLLLNPDCTLRADALARLQRHNASLPDLTMIGARIQNEDGSDQRGCRRDLLTPATALVEALHLSRFFPRYRLNRHEEAMPDALSPIPAISGAFMFLSRTAYAAIGGFDEAYFLHVEDLDLCWRFRAAGGEIYFAPDIIATHIGATSAATSDFIERHKAVSFSRYFHSHFKDKYPRILLWGLDIAIWMRYFLRRMLGA